MIANNIHIKLLGTISLGIGLVVILFISSEKQLHQNNAFTRSYPPHPVIKLYDLDLGYNSYYIAGTDHNEIYLGNSTAPWHLLKVNISSKDTLHIELAPTNKQLRYRSLKVYVSPPFFFVMDGTMPFILRGKVGEWKARPWIEQTAYFNKALPLDSTKILIRTISSTTHQSTLGIIEHFKSPNLILDTSLLRQHIDGVFDVDGILIKNGYGPEVGYVFFYKNQFMIMDSHLKNVSRQRTIDTVEQAQIRVGNQNKKGQISMSAPPLTINKFACIAGRFVLIQSDRLGKNENKAMLDQASIIDVYNYKEGIYAFSFYLYHIAGHKPRAFEIIGNHMVALVGDQLSIYRTIEPFFENLNIIEH